MSKFDQVFLSNFSLRRKRRSFFFSLANSSYFSFRYPHNGNFSFSFPYFHVSECFFTSPSVLPRLPLATRCIKLDRKCFQFIEKVQFFFPFLHSSSHLDANKCKTCSGKCSLQLVLPHHTHYTSAPLLEGRKSDETRCPSISRSGGNASLFIIFRAGLFD